MEMVRMRMRWRKRRMGLREGGEKARLILETLQEWPHDDKRIELWSFIQVVVFDARC